MRYKFLKLLILSIMISCAPPSKIERTIVTPGADTQTEEESLSLSATFSLVLDTANTQRSFLLSDMSEFPENALIESGSLLHVNDLSTLTNSNLLMDYTLNPEYIVQLISEGKSADSFQDQFSLVLSKDEKTYLLEVNLNVSILVLDDDGGFTNPASITAPEYPLESSYLNKVTYVDLRTLVNTNFQCGEVSFSEDSCENCSTNGTFPIIEITPTQIGDWEFNYTARCTDNVTLASSKVLGIARDEDQSANITLKDMALSGASSYRVSLSELVIAVNDDCSPQDRSELTYEIGTCLMCEVTTSDNNSNIVITPQADTDEWSLDVYGICKDGVTRDKSLLSGRTLDNDIKIFAEDKTVNGEEVNQEIMIDVSELITSEGECGNIVFSEISSSQEVQCIGCEKSGEFPEVIIRPLELGDWFYRYKASCENDPSVSVNANIIGTNTKSASIVAKSLTQQRAGANFPKQINMTEFIVSDGDYTCELVVINNSETNVVVSINEEGFEAVPQASGDWGFEYTGQCQKDSKVYNLETYSITGVALGQTGGGSAPAIIKVKNVGAQENGVEFISTTKTGLGNSVEFRFEFDLSLFGKDSASTINTVSKVTNNLIRLSPGAPCSLEGDKVQCRVMSNDEGENISYSIEFEVTLDSGIEDKEKKAMVTFTAQGKFIAGNGNDNER